MIDPAILEAMADLLPEGCSYIIAVQEPHDPAPHVFHTMDNDEDLARAFRVMAKALESDA